MASASLIWQTRRTAHWDQIERQLGKDEDKEAGGFQWVTGFTVELIEEEVEGVILGTRESRGEGDDGVEGIDLESISPHLELPLSLLPDCNGAGSRHRLSPRVSRVSVNGSDLI